MSRQQGPALKLKAATSGTGRAETQARILRFLNWRFRRLTFSSQHFSSSSDEVDPSLPFLKLKHDPLPSSRDCFFCRLISLCLSPKLCMDQIEDRSIHL
jgi:hypothetical protein